MRISVLVCFCLIAGLTVLCASRAANSEEYRAPVSGALMAPPLPKQTTRRLLLPPETTQQTAQSSLHDGSLFDAALPRSKDAVVPLRSALESGSSYSLQSHPGIQGAVPNSHFMEGKGVRDSKPLAPVPSEQMNPLSPASTKPPLENSGSPERYRGVPMQEEDIVFGTSRLEGSHFLSRGRVRHWRDSVTGDIITHVVPPPPPAVQQHEPLLIAPRIYPDVFGLHGYDHGSRHGHTGRTFTEQRGGR